ncbi:thiopurine S-methyltransferase [Shewanella maritima]|uniref:thiopurine S-methyltransferase n=1 Tax=Shewanella maritima TaxID=2520507 RepID=UPI00373517CA
MEPSFWHQKWESKQIGFHQDQVNPFLVKYWASVKADPRQSVFVPLCGKSLDMCYLAEQGHRVIGCELNLTAVKDFFVENQLSYQTHQHGEHTVLEDDTISLYQGDIFTLPPEATQHIGSFYDRAALIAWPDDLRQQYAAKLAQLIPAGTSGLLVTLDYPQAELNGPPFAVSPQWIEQYLATHFDVELLTCEDVLAENPRFVNKQVSWLNEAVYRLTRK